MVYSRVAPAVIAVLLLGSALGMEVKLKVEEPVGTVRKYGVVSGGIPLPEGKYTDPARFSLFEGGREVPVQVSPIVKYPDGSLHWVLVSFPVSLGAKEKKSFVLRDRAPSAKVSSPVVVKEEGSRVVVSNGLVEFAVDREKFNGFEYVSYKGRKVFTAPSAALVANGKGGPARLTHFRYVYRGPLKVTLYLKGTYGSLKTPTWAMSVALNAGEPIIHLDHNLRNGGKGVRKIKVSDPQLRLRTVGTLAAGEGGTAPVRRKRDKAAWGWKLFKGDVPVMIFMRHGGPGTPVYDMDIEKGDLVIRMGMGKQHEVDLPEGAHKVTQISIVLGGKMEPLALAEPLHALADCRWYSTYDSMGVGWGFGSLEEETLAYKNYGIKGAGDPRRMPHEKPHPNLYRGWLDVHGTSECDQIRGLTVAYVRTGQRGFLDRARAWMLYYRSRYLWRTDDYVLGKEGGRRIGKWVGGRLCYCHAYGAGMFNYAMLTGEVDALEAAFEAAEIANAAYGSASRKWKPGMNFSWWGSRPFARLYAIVVRAYEISRSREWLEALAHYARMATRTDQRDPRGFTNHGVKSTWTAKELRGFRSKKRGSPEAVALYEKEGTKIGPRGICEHPKYGKWYPKSVGTWPEAIEARANYMAAVLLAKEKAPQLQVLAEDVKDYALAEAKFGMYWAYDDRLKQVYYYFYVDFPIPGYVPLWKGGRWAGSHREVALDGWYTRWWPDAVAYGYVLGGGKEFRDKAMEIWIQGVNRGYWTLPKAADDEVLRYAFVHWNTKGDWVSSTALTFGVCAHPRRDEKGPEPVKDLEARALGGGKVELTWTAPRDAGGKVARYQLKYAFKRIADYPATPEAFRAGWRKVTYWNMARNVYGEPSPSAPGGRERMVLEGLPAGKTLFFAVRSEDDSGNYSTLSNVTEVKVK